MQCSSSSRLSVEVRAGTELGKVCLGDDRWNEQICWLQIFQAGLRHEPYLLTIPDGRQVHGALALALVRSALFGKFLVSLPYIDSAGAMADSPEVQAALVDRAVRLADELDVRYLELRHESRVAHAALNGEHTGKVHMRLELPTSSDALWRQLRPKVRNQIRKARRHPLRVHWGREPALEEFYRVFSINMRDLGTPVFGRALFRAILQEFPSAEFCIVRLHERPVAAALVIHNIETTAVPSAAALRAFRSSNANMLMYWHLLRRAVERGSSRFDFGRSSTDSGTFRFKKQWGAVPHPAVWQYYVRRGDRAAMRPDSPRNRRLARIWRRLPLPLTRLIGPAIVRGIP